MNAEPMNADHADALIEFMRDYFQHVYVMPKKLAKYDFTKKGMTKPPTAAPTRVLVAALAPLVMGVVAAVGKQPHEAAVVTQP